MEITDKTYIMKRGKDIRDCKMQGPIKLEISEMNERIAGRRIRLAESINAGVNQYGCRIYAKVKKIGSKK